ncbi:class II fructose-bisphosphatase [Rickettsiales bacterium]|nr:class II fructose-bisphosphatase [Rickettsiales bacterium]
MTKISDITSGALKTAENAAIACYDWIGKGKEKLADAAAVDAMRTSLNQMPISGTIVIGEGERDEAPMLYIGEEVGTGGLELDIALDPLEGTTICATANANSLAVIAFAKKGNLLNAPDVYMDKIAIGPNLSNDIIDLDNSVYQNLKNLAQAKKCDISDLTAVILDRSRHEELIAKSREAGARVKLIADGDIAAAIATTDPVKTGIDIYMGTGGAPEGVLAAAALKVSNSQMLGRLIFNDNQKQIERAKKMGITDLNKKYSLEQMAKGDCLFIASGVTDGSMIGGIIRNDNYDIVSSLVMDSAQKSIKIINSKYLK